MNKLRKMMYGFLFAIVMSATPQVVAANELAGPWIAINASINGVELDGQHIDNNLSTTQGSLGAIAPVLGLEVGYSIPMGARFALGLGVEWTSGEGAFDGDAGSDDANVDSGDVEITFGDHITGYLMPQIMIDDDTALFVKLGINHVSIAATGDIDGGSVPSSLGGATLAFGTRSLFGNGAFIQFEGGLREYDEFSAFGGGTNTNGQIKADPLVAYGGVSLGIKF